MEEGPTCICERWVVWSKGRFGALRFSAGSDAGEECPVGLAGVEQRADAVVGEAAEPEGGAFDALDEVVDRLGGAVGDPGAVPVHDRVMPAAEGAAQAAQLRRAGGVL